MTSSLRAFLRATVCFLALYSTSFAQSQLASLSGRVTDPSGGVVAGAAVELKNIDTGEHFRAATNSTGAYVLPIVKPGKYEFQAEASGFKRYQRTGLVLETGLQARLDVQLDVGSIQDSVTVEASAPLLQSESSAVGNVVQNRTIVNMPLINRRALQLVKLSGFVTPIGNDQGRASMAGGRGAENMFSVDGGLIQNVATDTPEPFFDPPIESLQEFNVSISNYSAELGRTGGGVVQVTTKSGTNQFHGSAYEYLRNDALDARTFFAAGKEKLRYNLFGGSLGGPIRRDKTHFFFNYEGLRSRQEVTQIVNVPTRAEALGDFSGRAVVRDPANGVAFPNNIIPASRLDPVGAKLAALFPEPNVAGRPTRSSNFRAAQPVNLPSNNYVGRVDHVFREADRLYGRILALTSRSDRGPVFPTPGIDSFNQIVVTTYQNLSGAWFHTFSPTVINEFRMAWVRRTAPQWHGGLDSGAVDQIGLKGTDPRLFPRIEVEGLTQFGNANRQYRSQSPVRSNNFSNRLTKIHGSHAFKLGYEYRSDSNLDLFQGTGGGRFTFSSIGSGDALASLQLGWVRDAFRQSALPLKSRADYMAAFVQDDWKVTPTFTLNLGLRWDYEQPRWEVFGNRQNSFDRSAINPVSGTPGVVTFSGRNGLSKYAHDKDLNNFGPRLGFAWQPGKSWVVRGGGALIYLANYNNNVAFDPSLGFGILGNFVSPDSGLTPSFLLRNGMPVLSVPAESDLTPGFGAARLGENPATSVLFLETGARATGYLEQFNLNVQKQLGQGMLIEAGYIATLGHKLPAPSNQTINQVPTSRLGPGNAQVLRPFPQFSNVQVMLPAIGNSNYHAMNLRFDKRLSLGLHFQANYTWSKFIDDTEARAELGGAPGTGFADYYNRRADRGLSGNHLSHRFIWSSVYELPVGKGRSLQLSNPVAEAALGGWSLGYILEMRTGPPWGAVEQTNRTNSFSDSVRPNVVGVAEISGDRSRDSAINRWFNIDAFAAPAQFAFGNAAKSSGYGPGAVTMDLSILKSFSIREQHSLQFRAEALNLANRPNFGLPATSRGAANFGQIRSLAPGNQSRLVQLGLHYRF